MHVRKHCNLPVTRGIADTFTVFSHITLVTLLCTQCFYTTIPVAGSILAVHILAPLSLNDSTLLSLSLPLSLQVVAVRFQARVPLL